MKNRIVKPLALAVGLAVCTGALAAPGGAFDIKELDTSKDVCNDFNGFVNAKWIAANPIPDDRTRWGSFDALREGSLNVQHTIVEKAAKGATSAKAGSIEQKIGYFYASGMDEAAIEKAGYEPIKPELARIGALKNSSDIVAYITDSYAHGNPVAFRFYGSPDFKNSNNQIAYAGQGGLGLPTADYYSKPDFEKIRTEYVAHIARTLQLVGVSEADAQAQAKAVMAFETRLASASLVPTELRQPENRYHYVSIADADKVTPHFDWAAFFKAQGADVQEGFSLSQPKFFAEFDKMLADVPVSDWQAYLRFHAIDEAAPYLSKTFQQEDFAFNAKT
ncbi:MAG: peptidase, partial [Dyella sp.]|nr:peptidase [Dyella sp.]